MSAILTRIRDRGFQLEVDDGGLTVYPASQLTRAQRVYIKEHRGAIIKALEAESESRGGSANPHSGVCGDAGRDGRRDGLHAGEPGNKTGTRAGDEATQGRPNSCAPIAGEDRDQALEERRGFMEYDGGPEETLDLTRENYRQEALPESAKARRFKVTLKSGGVLLHSAPSGLTRREAIELSRDWGEVAECVPAEEAPVTTPAVICGDCQHFQRIDHPHTGRCAKGHGRYWLWDTDKRLCEDFEAAGGAGGPGRCGMNPYSDNQSAARTY